jgi:hypothetical protein
MSRHLLARNPQRQLEKLEIVGVNSRSLQQRRTTTHEDTSPIKEGEKHGRDAQDSGAKGQEGPGGECRGGAAVAREAGGTGVERGASPPPPPTGPSCLATSIAASASQLPLCLPTAVGPSRSGKGRFKPSFRTPPTARPSPPESPADPGALSWSCAAHVADLSGIQARGPCGGQTDGSSRMRVHFGEAETRLFHPDDPPATPLAMPHAQRPCRRVALAACQLGKEPSATAGVARPAAVVAVAAGDASCAACRDGSIAPTSSNQQCLVAEREHAGIACSALATELPPTAAVATVCAPGPQDDNHGAEGETPVLVLDVGALGRGGGLEGALAGLHVSMAEDLNLSEGELEEVRQRSCGFRGNHVASGGSARPRVAAVRSAGLGTAAQSTAQSRTVTMRRFLPTQVTATANRRTTISPAALHKHYATRLKAAPVKKWRTHRHRQQVPKLGVLP